MTDQMNPDATASPDYEALAPQPGSVGIDLSLNGEPQEDEDQRPAQEGEPQPEADPEAESPEPAAEPAAEPLPDYDDSDEARAKYEAAYFKDDGELNLQRLNDEFYASLEKAGGDISKAGVSEGTRKFLKAITGISEAGLRDIEVSLYERNKAQAEAVFSKVGGKEAVQEAVKWATEGKGYTPEQVARYERAMKSGGEDRDDALELLMDRYTKANPQPASTQLRPRRQYRGGPQRDATSRAAGGNSKAGDVFQNMEEYSAAYAPAYAKLAEAKRSGVDADIAKATSTLEYLDRKVRRSPFYNKQNKKR